MTPAQIVEWLKAYLKFLSKIDFAAIKKALDFQAESTIERARLKRALANVGRIELVLDDLRTLATASTEFAARFEDALKSVEGEIKEALISPMEEHKKA